MFAFMLLGFVSAVPSWCADIPAVAKQWIPACQTGSTDELAAPGVPDCFFHQDCLVVEATPAPSQAGNCDANDLTLQGNLAQDIPQCLRESQQADTIAQCIRRDGFSPPCAGCIGLYGACIIDKCVDEGQCRDNGQSQQCKTCYTDKCIPYFLTCTGFPATSPSVESFEALEVGDLATGDLAPECISCLEDACPEIVFAEWETCAACIAVCLM